MNKENINLIVNNKVYNFDKNVLNMTIFQVCSLLSIDIPCFCYQENLSIAGNCRMCLVEVSTSLKLVVSCSMNVLNGMKIFLYNYRVKKARESVLELLLANHPLECPVCDQAGECDLQDITFTFGSDKGRFYENEKRAVRDFNCGPYVKTLMTRCIHCTRCVRFLTEVTGVYDFGMVARGMKSEISTYVLKSLNDELSGNIIDLCPVGALTSKPYSFEARHWELNSVESIDILDVIGSSIKADILNNKIVRIIPSMNSNINEDWLSNKIRFSYDLLNSHRLSNPLYKLDEKFVVFSWLKIISLLVKNINEKVKIENFGVILGSFESLDLIYKVKDVFSSIGCLNINSLNNINIDGTYRLNYIIKNLNKMLKNYHNLVLIGINMRNEFPLINVKVRKNFRKSIDKKIYVFGKGINYFTFNVLNIGNESFDLINMIEGRLNIGLYYNKYKFVLSTIVNKLYKKNLFFTSSSFKNIDLLRDCLVKKGVLYNLFHKVTSLNYMEVGFKKNYYNIKLTNEFNFLYLINTGNFLKLFNSFNGFKVYQGSHYDFDAKNSDIILPTMYYYEESLKYLSIEGKINKTSKIVVNESNVYSGIDVMKMLKYVLGIKKLDLFSKMFKLKNVVNMFNNKIFVIKFFDFLKLYSAGNYLIIKDILTIKKNKVFISNFLINSVFLNIYKSDYLYSMSKNITSGAFFYKNEIKIF